MSRSGLPWPGLRPIGQPTISLARWEHCSWLEQKGTYNRKLHSLVLIKQNSLSISLYKNKSLSTILSSTTPINLSFWHIPIRLYIPVITKERHNQNTLPSTLPSILQSITNETTKTILPPCPSSIRFP